VAEGRGVGNQAGARIRVYSADGTFLQAIGRREQGPGAFQSIQALALDSKDRIVVYDRRLRRFTRYAPFEEISSFPVPAEEHRNTFPTACQVGSNSNSNGFCDDAGCEGGNVQCYRPPQGGMCYTSDDEEKVK